jgi:hypothetical protein
MDPKRIATVLSVAVCLCMVLPVTPLFAQEPKSARQSLDRILKATEDNDYTNFVGEGDAGFKVGITPPMLEAVSA